MDTSASKIFKDLQRSQHRISSAGKYRMAKNENHPSPCENELQLGPEPLAPAKL
jgi:hypothetical protein